MSDHWPTWLWRWPWL